MANFSEKKQNSEKFILPSPSRHASHPEMIEKSFSVCGIATHNPQKKRNDEFLRSTMQNVNEKIHEGEEGLLEERDEDPFYNI